MSRPRKVLKSAIDGEFVSPEGADPATTYEHAVRTPADQEAELRHYLGEYLPECFDTLPDDLQARVRDDPSLVEALTTHFAEWTIRNTIHGKD